MKAYAVEFFLERIPKIFRYYGNFKLRILIGVLNFFLDKLYKNIYSVILNDTYVLGKVEQSWVTSSFLKSG